MPRPAPSSELTADDLAATAEAIDLRDGPWRSAFAFWIPGRVRSKSNYRQDKKTAWSELTGYDETVALTARQHLPATWTQPTPSLPASLRGLGAYAGAVTQPAAADPVMPVVAHLTARSLLDTGNVSKSVLDALEGLLYANDAHVAAASELVVRAKADQGLLAGFAQLDVGADYVAVAKAHVALQVAVNAAVHERLTRQPEHGTDSSPVPDDCAAGPGAHPASASTGTPDGTPTHEELIRA